MPPVSAPLVNSDGSRIRETLPSGADRRYGRLRRLGDAARAAGLGYNYLGGSAMPAFVGAMAGAGDEPIVSTTPPTGT